MNDMEYNGQKMHCWYTVVLCFATRWCLRLFNEMELQVRLLTAYKGCLHFKTHAPPLLYTDHSMPHSAHCGSHVDEHCCIKLYVIFRQLPSLASWALC